jgi:chemotaxis protein histidine kinase CheA
MSVVRTFHPEVRLKKLLVEPGGMKAGDALYQATERLDDIREDCLSAVDAKIEALTLRAQSEDETRLEDIYRTANEIFAEAGAFGLGELSAAAHSLCSLVATGAKTRAANAAISVHIDAMRVLRNPDIAGDAAARAAVIAGLRGLGARLAAQQ